ncbi:MAG: T9SS type A sorting domain-containing protein [Promethearchaeota archaeon]
MKFKLIIIIIIILQICRLFSEVIWEADYGLMGADQCAVEPSMTLCSDGGFIIIGDLGYEYWPGDIDWIGHVIKFDNTGDILWNHTEENGGSPEGVFETITGNYITIGKIYGPDIAYVSKRDCYGDTLWVKQIEDFYFRSFIGYDDSSFYIGGRNSTTLQASLIRMDLDGNIIWTYYYDAGDFFSGGIITSDDCFVLRLFISDTSGNYNVLVKVDSNGEILWTFNPGISSIKALLENSDNELIVSTWEHIIKMDLDGNIINQIDGSFYYAIDLPSEECFLAESNIGYNYIINKFDYNLYNMQEITDFPRFFFQLIPDNGFLFYHERSIHLIRTDENIVSTDNHSVNFSQNQISNFPNPFNPSTTIEFSIQNDSQIEISIYNIKGQKTKTLINNGFTKGSHSIIWNGDDDFGNSVSSGIYYYKLIVNEKIESVKKCLLLK